MKKILLASVMMLTVSACTSPIETITSITRDTSFAGLYRDHVNQSIAQVETLYTDLGMSRHEAYTDGKLSSSLSVPGMLSGSLQMGYDGIVDGRNSQIFFRNLKLAFTSLVSSGALSADEVGVTSVGVENYISYKNIVDAGFIPEDIKKILTEYQGMWLRIDQDTKNMTPEELMSYTITKNLLQKSPKDILGYFVKYPIWKDKADLGMSGSLHAWSVDLHRENILALVQNIKLDLAGTGMTAEDTKNLQDTLAKYSFSGTLTFDPSKKDMSHLQGAFSYSGKTIMDLNLKQDTNMMELITRNPENKMEFGLKYTKTEPDTRVSLSAKGDGIEMGKIDLVIHRDKGIFQSLVIDGSAQGVAVKLEHMQSDSGFTGKLSSPAGTMNWSGSLRDGALTGLNMVGNSPFAGLSLDLTQSGSDTMLHGPLSVKYGSETFRANIGLEVAHEKFGIIFDSLQEQLPVHFDLISSVKVAPSKSTISIPKSTKRLQDLLDAIDALTPKIAPTLEDSVGNGDEIPSMPENK